MHVILNNQLTDSQNARISINDRGFRYGDGVFETIAVHQGVPYQLSWHQRRLQEGLAAIKIKCDIGGLKEQCRSLIKHNNVQDGLLRIQITRGEGGRGYLPDADAKPTVLIETLPMPQVPREPVALWLSGYEKTSLNALPVTSKLCSGLNSVLARIEAGENHCAEALLLNADGHITETGSANIFWLQNKILYTPSLSCGVLDGSTRAITIRLSPYPVKEVAAPVEVLKEAEAVFLTNVLLKTLPIGTLLPRRYDWDSAPLASQFHDLIKQDIARAGDKD